MCLSSGDKKHWYLKFAVILDIIKQSEWNAFRYAGEVARVSVLTFHATVFQ